MSAEAPTLGLAFIAGFLSFISPCVLPLVPAYISYMGGRMTHIVAAQVTVAGAAGGQNVIRPPVSARFSMLIHGVFFVAGFTIVFVLLGIAANILLGSARDIVGRVGGILIIFFGLNFMGGIPSLSARLRANTSLLNSPITTIVMAVLVSALLWWAFLGSIFSLVPIVILLLWFFMGGGFTQPGIFWTKVLNTIQLLLYSDTRRQMTATGQQGFLGSSLMGIVFAAGWTPCIGPILGSILGVAASASGGDVLSASGLLVAYSLGLGIPFLIAALMLDGAQGILRRLRRHMHTIELVTGGFLVIVGIGVLTGELQNISQQATAQFSDLSIRVEECGVGFVTGEIDISNLGPCVNGQTELLTIGNVVQNTLTSDSQAIQYIFPGEAGKPVDIEMKDRTNDQSLKPLVILLDAQQNEIARSGAATILTQGSNTNNIATISHFVIPQSGVYTVIATQSDTGTTVKGGIFTVRISEANDEQPAKPTLNSITGAASAINAPAPVIGTNLENLAPDFEGVTDAGKSVKLSALRGHVVVLNFWATWCGPCRVEMPEFERAYEANGQNGFTILAVDNMESRDKVTGFRQELGLTFPMVMDEQGTLQKLYGIVSYPSTYVIDRQGVIIAKQFGPLTAQEIDELVTKALA